MKLRDNFLTVCAGCDGDGKVENEVFQMGEVKYYYTQCDCENGKELDWQKVDSEIKDTKLKIEINQMSVDNHNQFMRDAIKENNEPLALICLRSLIEYENKATELELYLAELEDL
jgi:excinuclease UvrABC ATPase subunit